MSRNREVQDAAEAADEARIQVEEAWLAVKTAEDRYSEKHAAWQAAVHTLDELVKPRTAADLLAELNAENAA